MAGNFPAVSAVLLLQRMLNLSASYTALLIMLCTQLSTTDVDVCYLPRYQEPAGNRFYPDQRQEFWYRSIFLSFNLKNSRRADPVPARREFHSSFYLRYASGTSSHF